MDDRDIIVEVDYLDKNKSGCLVPVGKGIVFLLCIYGMVQAKSADVFIVMAVFALASAILGIATEKSHVKIFRED